MSKSKGRARTPTQRAQWEHRCRKGTLIAMRQNVYSLWREGLIDPVSVRVMQSTIDEALEKNDAKYKGIRDYYISIKEKQCEQSAAEPAQS